MTLKTFSYCLASYIALFSMKTYSYLQIVEQIILVNLSNSFNFEAMKKEILIDGENREFKMPNANKLVKVITEEALKRIVKLGYFETIVKIIFEEKYPEIKHKQLDLEAIIK